MIRRRAPLLNSGLNSPLVNELLAQRAQLGVERLVLAFLDRVGRVVVRLLQLTGDDVRVARGARPRPDLPRAGNRHLWLLSALRAHTKAPWKTDLLWETLRVLNRPERARTVEIWLSPFGAEEKARERRWRLG